jgi:hypothetical protein
MVQQLTLVVGGKPYFKSLLETGYYDEGYFGLRQAVLGSGRVGLCDRVHGHSFPTQFINT